MKQEIITLTDVAVHYQTKRQRVPAVETINLAIHEGEFVCLVGPSGCGKSTILKMIAGYLQPTTGLCQMHGQTIEGPNWNRGVVFQTPSLFPWLTVTKNISYGLRMRHVPKEQIEESVTQALQQVHLQEAEKRYPFELSGGMKQRVTLARALVNEPELLLLDEPFGALDALTRMSMQRLLRQLWAQKRQTFFMITHDIEEALSLATTIYVMSPSPGTIVNKMMVNYAQQAVDAQQEEITMDEQFFERKETILSLIQGKE